MKVDSLIKAATAVAPTIANNQALPSMAAWQARSTWLIVLTLLISAANGFGIDLMAHLSEIGFGATPEAVVDRAVQGVSAVQILLPFATGVWAWFERRAPNFRLTLRKTA